MGNHRMFSKRIVETGRFQMLPRSVRLLYYDLGMSADDDGVVDAFTVMRATGARRRELDQLIGSGYLQLLNDELVVHISDWRENNLIRKDRYKPSIHAALLREKGLPSGVSHPVDDPAAQDKESQEEEKKSESKIRESAATNAQEPPTLEEIRQHMERRADLLTADWEARRFYVDCRAKDWTQDGVPIADWRAAADAWLQQYAPA